MKKALASLLAAGMAASLLAGCGGSSSTAASTADTSTAASTEASSTAESDEMCIRDRCQRGVQPKVVFSLLQSSFRKLASCGALASA